MASPSFESLLPTNGSGPVIDELETMAHKAAYDLLSELNSRATNDKWLQICTSESLTAGMIMSTLVDIPWGGYLKYGCFGVYDTDAKRVFNKVSVDDVYTHRCAKEMAVGILKNSNASLAIAVTGNAMPLNDHVDMLGEVFIGIAGYAADEKNSSKTKIIHITKSINMCDNNIEAFKQTCSDWYTTIKRNAKYNPRDRTAAVSREIRLYTTYNALKLCLEFVNNNNPIVPQFVIDRKKANDVKDMSTDHITIPENKYNDSIEEICVSEPKCHNLRTPKRVNTATYPNVVLSQTTGGKRKTRKNMRRNARKNRYTRK